VAPITFANVGKVYPDGTRAVDDLNLEIHDGEFMVLVGPSGCGKTTALRMVAGLEEITEGEVRIGDVVANTLDPSRRDIAMVFQNYALYPHMSVFENIAFPLRSRRLPRAEIKTRVEKTAQILGLSELLKRKPRTLSGGQRQRVAMGRAIVREPQAFLMDEPLSNLDAKLRVQMRAEISRLQRDLGVTTIYVTHDQVEAMTMGTRIAVMRKGVLQQEGVPQTLYDNPANLFVATFIGSPGMNLFRARVASDAGGGPALQIRDQLVRLGGASATGALAAFREREVAVGIRPEHLVAQPSNGVPTIKTTVVLTEALGAERLLHVALRADPVVTDDVIEIAEDIDPALLADLENEEHEHHVTLIGRVDTSFAPATDTPVELGLQLAKLHFFDLDTGVAIR
jgi:multiple sugar transport system ATP-binding protein